MANWDGTKPISTDTLNGGNQYTTDSQLSVQALNSIIESGLFSQNFVRNLQVAVNDSVGTPSVSLQPQVDNPNYKTIAFSGLKGVGIQTIVPKYYASQTTNTPDKSLFSERGAELTSTDRYLWLILHLAFTNGMTQETNPQIVGVYGDKGDTGVGIQSITITESTGN